jgi:hypothetical protein
MSSFANWKLVLEIVGVAEMAPPPAELPWGPNSVGYCSRFCSTGFTSMRNIGLSMGRLFF